MRLTLVRHGNTDANNERWLQGQLDTQLNRTGLEQANHCGYRLKDEQYQHVYCSDLTRCKQTAAGIIGYQPNLSIEYTAKLRERDFGKLSGRPIKYLKTESIQQKISAEELIIKSEGESVEIFRKRVIEAYENIFKDAKEKGYERILIVTHGGPLRHLSDYWIKEKKYKIIKGLNTDMTVHGNTAITIIENEIIIEYNSTSHLGNQELAPPPAV